MYALACRHGWGIRVNEVEGVSWLKKAVEAAGVHIAEIEDGGPFSLITAVAPVSQVVTHSGHAPTSLDLPRFLAPSLYELGISYLHGWGVSRSPIIALRYFTASASLDDADALAEAGECYAKGIGCKKDLKRAAELLRRAEGLAGKKGEVRGVGRSWIWKEKYGGEAKGKEKDKDKEKDREKEKGRLGMKILFGVGAGAGKG